jgi:hypothetical protein
MTAPNPRWSAEPNGKKARRPEQVPGPPWYTEHELGRSCNTR